jgi:hypothetical protein
MKYCQLKNTLEGIKVMPLKYKNIPFIQVTEDFDFTTTRIFFTHTQLNVALEISNKTEFKFIIDCIEILDLNVNDYLLYYNSRLIKVTKEDFNNRFEITTIIE